MRIGVPIRYNQCCTISGSAALVPMEIPSNYETVMGSDLARDGMFLELWDLAVARLALWAFFSDVDGAFEFTKYRNDVPASVESWFQQEARRRLPPINAIKRGR